LQAVPKDSTDRATALALTQSRAYVGNTCDTEGLTQFFIVELAKAQQKNVAKAERKAARKAAERQKLAPVPAPAPAPEPTSDDDDYIELSKT
jgi:hypothetical protein